MTSYLELARAFDRESEPLHALWAYEIAIVAEPFELHDYLNFVAIYFACCDFGFAHANGLHSRLSATAYERSVAILDLAEGQYASEAEIEAWRALLRARVLYDTIPLEMWKGIAARGSAIGQLFAFLDGDGLSFRTEAQAVWNTSKRGFTERERYIASLGPF